MAVLAVYERTKDSDAPGVVNGLEAAFATGGPVWDRPLSQSELVAVSRLNRMMRERRIAREPEDVRRAVADYRRIVRS